MGSHGSRRSFDPLVNYAFSVSMDGLQVANFYGVEGINFEVEMIEYRSSEEPNVPHFRQGRKKTQRVTFKRGVLVEDNSDFLDWIMSVENGTVEPKELSVTISGNSENGKNEADSSSNNWVLHECYPTKWSLGSLEGTGNTALIETLEVVVSEVRRK